MFFERYNYLLLMVRKEHRQMLSFVITDLFIFLNPMNNY